MALRKVDRETTRRFEDDGDWIELRTQLSKGDADELIDIANSRRVSAEEGMEFVSRLAAGNRRLFEILIVDWSLDEKPTGQAYAELDGESGAWVDRCIAELLEERRARAEGNSRSNKRRPSSRSSSRSAGSRTQKG